MTLHPTADPEMDRLYDRDLRDELWSVTGPCVTCGRSERPPEGCVACGDELTDGRSGTAIRS
jgi:hypothetical protein